ncbi:MAG: hypothetical protein ABI995_08270 [Acidobacteriota bacterium]
MRDGTHAAGRVLAVKADALELAPADGTRGPLSIPRTDVTLIHLAKKTKNTRLIGVGVGGAVIAGTAAAGYQKQGYGGVFVLLMGASVGLGIIVTSVFAGHGARKESVEIRIVTV